MKQEMLFTNLRYKQELGVHVHLVVSMVSIDSCYLVPMVSKHLLSIVSIVSIDSC